MGAIVALGLYVDNPEAFVATSLDPRPGMLGLVLNPPGSTNLYQCVQLDATSDAAGAATKVVYWCDPAKYSITMTIGESEAGNGTSAAGVLTATVAVSSYAFLKVRGIASTAVASGSKGDLGVPHTGSNQLTPNLETLFTRIVGIYLSNASSNLSNVRLMFDPL